MSLSSSFTCDWTYDVFLSFRGIDTRNNFTSNLYNSLHQRGINTFFDDQQIYKGDEITPTLLQAIKHSRIFIAVFSNNYASSTFCLTELVTILECSKSHKRLFLPVFYDVDPSQIRHITGTYAEAFAKHEARFRDEKEKVQKWRDALHQAANMSGWHFKPGSEVEYRFIGKIVEEVSLKINRIPLHVATKPVGLESQMLEVTSLLGLESNERVSMVGIYGIGGIGKSTLARAVHNLVADQFESVCFLADIRQQEAHHGLTHLQETLLSEILGEKDIKVGNVYRGMSIIKRRLQRKKVLLILDNIDREEQLQVLVGEHDWFGSGSKIIITTRDKHVLATHGIVKVYEVKQLNKEKALELFSWHAFKIKEMDPSYVDIAKHAVSYCHGLPLTLEVLGSQFFGKSLAEWKSSLDKYERVIHKDIHDILKILLEGTFLMWDDLEEDLKSWLLEILLSWDDLDEDEKGILLETLMWDDLEEDIKDMLRKTFLMWDDLEEDLKGILLETLMWDDLEEDVKGILLEGMRDDLKEDVKDDLKEDVKSILLKGSLMWDDLEEDVKGILLKTLIWDDLKEDVKSILLEGTFMWDDLKDDVKGILLKATLKWDSIVKELKEE